MTENRKRRVAIYARVSTADQNPEVQVSELRDYAGHRDDWKIVGEFMDQGVSGATDDRPKLKKLLAFLHAREADTVLVWKLDRLGRSVEHLYRLLNQFRELGVDFVSLRDPGLDTTTATGRVLFGMLSVFAQFERDILSERTKAGLRLARQHGSQLGRPRAYSDPDDIAAIREAHERGESYRDIAKDLGCSSTLIWKIVHQCQAPVHKKPSKMA